MPISEGSGGIGAGGSIPDDLVAIYQGGEYFLARMKAFEDSKQNALSALEQLRLGNSIVSAKADAEEKSQEAAKLHANAQAALTDAEASAAKLIEDAKAKAASLLEAAQKEAESLVSSANLIKSDADKHAATVTAAADAKHKEAEDRLKSAAENEEALKAKIAEAESAKAEAEAAKVHHDASKTTYEQKIAQIKAVMG